MTTDEPKTLAKLIEDRLASFPTARGPVALSYRQAQTKTTVSHSTIQRIVEGAENVKLTTLALLAGGLDLDLEDLVEAALR